MAPLLSVLSNSKSKVNFYEWTRISALLCVWWQPVSSKRHIFELLHHRLISGTVTIYATAWAIAVWSTGSSPRGPGTTECSLPCWAELGIEVVGEDGHPQGSTTLNSVLLHKRKKHRLGLNKAGIPSLFHYPSFCLFLRRGFTDPAYLMLSMSDVSDISNHFLHDFECWGHHSFSIGGDL
jgi:hypothetical protein